MNERAWGFLLETRVDELFEHGLGKPGESQREQLKQ
jgi:hypothetical protein